MVTGNDFFKGISKMRTIIILEALEGKGRLNVSEAEIDIINANSTKIFRTWTVEDIEQFEELNDSNRRLLHWVAGLNTREFLKIYK